MNKRPALWKKLAGYLRWRNVMFAAIALVSLVYAGWVFWPFVQPPHIVWEDGLTEEEKTMVAGHLDRLEPGWRTRRIQFSWEGLKARVMNGALGNNRVLIERIEGPFEATEPVPDFQESHVMEPDEHVYRVEGRCWLIPKDGPFGPTYGPFAWWGHHFDRQGRQGSPVLFDDGRKGFYKDMTPSPPP